MKNGLSNSEDLQLEQLRAILLTGDREEIRQLKLLLAEREAEARRLEDELTVLKNQLPKEYKPALTRLIGGQIKDSQQEIVDMLFPVLGQMIKKYIDYQFQLLKESIEAQIGAAKQKFNLWQRLKNRLAGVKESDALLAAAADPLTVMEVFLIEKDSGIVLGQATREATIDSESVAGMLTAIKAFVEDAFQRGEEQLDLIQYQTSKILISNYRSYYLAAVVRGSFTAAERGRLVERLENFMLQEFVEVHNRKTDRKLYDDLSEELQRWFLDPPPLHLLEKAMP